MALPNRSVCMPEQIEEGKSQLSEDKIQLSWEKAQLASANINYGQDLEVRESPRASPWADIRKPATVPPQYNLLERMEPSAFHPRLSLYIIRKEAYICPP